MALSDWKDVLTVELPVKPSKIRVGVCYFEYRDAHELIACCRHSHVGVLGIEGFKITEKYLIPDMSLIADFSQIFNESEEYFVDMSLSAADSFLESARAANLYFEFVLIKSEK